MAEISSWPSAERGTILSSPDGVTWTARASGTDRWLLAVDWAPGLFVAVGDGGTILVSPDGISWSPRSSGTTQRLNSVKRSPSTWLAVGEAGTARSSPNGSDWTLRATGDSGWLRGIAWGSGPFVVTGHDGTILTANQGGSNFQRRSSGTSRGSAWYADDVYRPTKRRSPTTLPPSSKRLTPM